MTPLTELEALANPAKAAEMLAHHKAPRRYLGVPNPLIDTLTDQWRAGLGVEDRVTLAATLWDTDIHEARIAAAKLLTQARLGPDVAAWDLIQSWVPQFDAFAIADHVGKAGEKRLIADPTRLDTLETWVTSPHLWTRRAALVMTLAWTKQNHPKPAEDAIRNRILTWCATLAQDRNGLIQGAIAAWVRDLSKHDAPRARAFLATHGATLKPFAQIEAARHLGDKPEPQT